MKVDMLRKDLMRRGFKRMTVHSDREMAEQEMKKHRLLTKESVMLKNDEGEWEVWVRQERYEAMNQLFEKKKKELEQLMEYDPASGVVTVQWPARKKKLP